MSKKKHTVLYTILGLILVIAAACVILYDGIQKDLSKLSAAPIADVDLALVADGTYKGSYSVFPVSAEVEVTVRGHTLQSARVISHQNGKGGAGEAILESAVLAGTLQVDTVSGATYSSKVLLNALRDALLKGIAP